MRRRWGGMGVGVRDDMGLGGGVMVISLMRGFDLMSRILNVVPKCY